MVRILSTDDRHNFDGIFFDSVIDTINSTYTPPITGFYKVHRFVQKWIFCYQIKTIKKSIEIFVRLFDTKGFDSIMMNSDQIIFCRVA